MKKVFSILIILFLAVFLFANKTSADGLIFTPRPNYLVQETAQKAVIWYKEGKETLILSASFKGDANEFVWIVPVPDKPEVDKAKDELFTALDDYTKPPGPTYDRSPIMGGVNLNSSGIYSPSLTVYETKRVDIYDIAVLAANNTNALADWLSENNYEYPENKRHLLEYYVQKNWFFVAAKINAQALGYAGSALKEGHATPLSITFNSPTIIYPLKISGLGAEDVITGKKIAAYSFESGSEGWPISSPASPNSQNRTTRFNYPRTTRDEAYHGKYSLLMADPELTNSTARSPVSLTNDLKPGQTYVLSGYLKVKNPKTATIYITTSNNTDIPTQVDNLKNYADWKRFSYPFTYKTGSNLLIEVTGASGETVYLDALQLDEGGLPSDFTNQLLPSSQPKGSGIDTDAPVSVILYVFADKKQDVPGFTTEFADQVNGRTIEKFSINEMGEPWIDADGKKYLTKLTRTMKPSQMVDDLVLREADNQKDVNGRFSGLPWWSSIILFIIVLSEVVVAGYYLWRYSKRKA